MLHSSHTSQSKRICLDFPSLHPSANIPSPFDPGTGKGMIQAPNLSPFPPFATFWLRFEIGDVEEDGGGGRGGAFDSSSSETKIAKWKFSPARDLK